MRTGALAACGLALLLAGQACSPPARHATLTLFFDGVPDLPSPVENKPMQVLAAHDGPRVRKPGYRAHGPYGARLCSACHLSTASNSFVVPKEKLCQNCHDFPLDKAHLHGPVAAGGCISCHDPHGSAHPSLLVADPATFCYRCHEQQDVASLPAHKETTKACTECHDPHQSDREHLLR